MEISKIFLYLISGVVLSAGDMLHRIKPSQVFDNELYERSIDREECAKQVQYMKNNDLFLYARFFDAGFKFPRGVFMLSITDLGNYHQCLGIKKTIEGMQIQGKYCFINIPFDQSFQLPFVGDNYVNMTNRKIVKFDNGIIADVQPFSITVDPDSLDPENPLLYTALNVAVCLPQPCTTQDWVKNVLFNVSAFGFKLEENFCRLPDDKPWVAADYVCIVIFSILGVITLLSTMYDINHVIIQKKDPRHAVILLRTFSVYNNTKRLLTFTKNPNALECLDGIRSISMMWVIVGHTFSMHNINADLSEAIKWLTSAKAIWVSAGLFTVDTFLLMAGILLVYSFVGKMNGVTFLKRLHAFYLNRLLRMFPLLAALVLLDASAFHRVGDGPYWENVARNIERCRTYWWTTLLHIQNWVNPDDICIQHSWYIAIDIQLHIVSPIVLFWVLGKSRKRAWTALVAALLAILTASTIWNFMKKLPASNMAIPRLDEQSYYMNTYYMNTLCRGAPFFIGMIVGYILNICKGKTIKLNRVFLLVSWCISFGMIALGFYAMFIIMELDWDNQVGDSLFNSFMRSIWVTSISWIIIACVLGYGGPINWFLSLSLWKVPARVSFAMYLYHYPICFIVAGMQVAPTYFGVGPRMFETIAIISLTFMVSFLVTVVIDAPFSVLIKMLMEGGPRKPRPAAENRVSSKLAPNEKSVGELGRIILTTLDKNQAFDNSFKYPQKNGQLDRQLSHLEGSDAPYLNKQLSYLEKDGPPMNNQLPDLEKDESSSGSYPHNLSINNPQLDNQITQLEKNHQQTNNQITDSQKSNSPSVNNQMNDLAKLNLTPKTQISDFKNNVQKPINEIESSIQNDPLVTNDDSLENAHDNLKHRLDNCEVKDKPEIETARF